MTEHQQHLSSEELAGLLAKAQGLTEAGTYHDALAAVREAKKLNPRNVYVLAFERQVEQLIELSLAGKLGDDERTDILESIPGIMDRALAGSGERAMPSAPAPDAAAADRARAERAAAHEWLKNQYFQHAHEYVKKGEYDHALAEIRRVFIIDPENAIARDFEAQIEELSRISRESASAQAAPGMPAPKPGPQSTRPAEKPRAPEEAAAKPRTNGETPPAGRKKLSPLSIILLFLALALLAFATVFLIKKLESPSALTPRSAVPPPQRELYAPEQAAPRADSTQVTPDSSYIE
jgi:tetratricopeptide (TPR) repeat protein